VVDTGVPKKASDPHPIYVYDVVDGVRLNGRKLFADMSPGSSDGIRCDAWTEMCGQRRAGARMDLTACTSSRRMEMDWEISLAGNLREYLFWRSEEKPVVYGGEPVVVCGVCGDGRRADAVS